MNRNFKFLVSFIDYKFHAILAGQKIHPINHSLFTSTIQNKQLAHDLETACKKNGFITFAQYLDISQFGPHGYYATHKYHGMTDSYLRWPPALVTICKKNNFHDLIEFGCGDGKLGIETITIAKKGNYQLIWHGIDINTEELTKAKKAFEKAGLKNNLGKLSQTIAGISLKKPCLVVCSYSFDSIPPEIFLNTTPKKNYPNTLLGITVKDSILTEIALTPQQVKKLGCTIEKGLYTNSKKQTFNLSSWKLHPFQRAYIPIQAYETLQTMTSSLPSQSLLVILDEFAPQPLSWHTHHLCLPKDLDKFGPHRTCTDIAGEYYHAGENLLYYPNFLASYSSALQSLGYTNIVTEGEHDMAKNMQHISHTAEYTGCFGILGTKKLPQEKIIEVRCA